MQLLRLCHFETVESLCSSKLPFLWPGLLATVAHHCFLRAPNPSAAFLEKKGGGTRWLLGRRNWKGRWVFVGPPEASAGAPSGHQLGWWASREAHEAGAPPLKPRVGLEGASVAVAPPVVADEGSGGGSGSRRVFPFTVTLGPGAARATLQLRADSEATRDAFVAALVAAGVRATGDSGGGAAPPLVDDEELARATATQRLLEAVGRARDELRGLRSSAADGAAAHAEAAAAEDALDLFQRLASHAVGSGSDSEPPVPTGLPVPSHERSVSCIMAALRAHESSKLAGMVAEAALWAARKLALCETEVEHSFTAALVSEGAVPAALAIMRRGEADARIVEASLRALSALSFPDTLSALVTGDTVPAATSALRRHEATPSVVDAALRALGQVSNDRNNVALLLREGSAHLAITVGLRKHEADAATAAVALQLLARLSKDAAADHNVQLMRDGAAAAAIAVMHKHSTDVRLTIISTGLLAELAECTGSHAQLVREGAVPAAVAAAFRFEKLYDITGNPGRMLRCLAGNSDYTALLLREAAALAAKCHDRAGPDSDTVETALKLLAAIAVGHMVPLLVRETGVRVALLTALRSRSGAHRAHVVIGAALNLLIRLTAGDPSTAPVQEAIALLVRDGAVTSALAALGRHEDDAEVVAAAMTALKFIGTTDDLCSQLTREGAVAAALSALRRHAADATVGEAALELLCRLAVFMDNKAVNAALMRKGEVMSAALAALQRRPTSRAGEDGSVSDLAARKEDSQEDSKEDADMAASALRLLASLVQSSAERCALLVREDGAPIVTAALVRHQAVGPAAEWALEVILRMLINHGDSDGSDHEAAVAEERRQLFVSLGAVSAAVAAFRIHKADADVISSALNVLRAFAAGDAAADALLALNAVADIIAVAQSHKSNADVVRPALGLCVSLMPGAEDTDRPGVIGTLARDGVVSLAVSALHVHDDDEGITRAALWVLNSVADDKTGAVALLEHEGAVSAFLAATRKVTMRASESGADPEADPPEVTIAELSLNFMARLINKAGRRAVNALVRVGAAAVPVTALRLPGSTAASMLETGLGVLRAIAQSDESGINAKLVHEGMVPVVLTALRAHHSGADSNADVVEAAIDALRALASGAAGAKAVLDLDGAIADIVNAARFNVANGEIVSSAVGLLYSLCANCGPVARSVVVRDGGVALAAIALRLPALKEDDASACGALQLLCAVAEEADAIPALVREGAAQLIAAARSRHADAEWMDAELKAAVEATLKQLPAVASGT